MLKQRDTSVSYDILYKQHITNDTDKVHFSGTHLTLKLYYGARDRNINQQFNDVDCQCYKVSTSATLISCFVDDVAVFVLFSVLLKNDMFFRKISHILICTQKLCQWLCLLEQQHICRKHTQPLGSKSRKSFARCTSQVFIEFSEHKDEHS